MTETVHAGCVAIGGRGILIRGRSGSGKSDLALRLIDRGARLVSDDYTILDARGGRIRAAAPAPRAGKLEIRGCLVADLDAPPERLPEPKETLLLGMPVPAIAIAALEASAPLKLEQALLRFGLPLP